MTVPTVLAPLIAAGLTARVRPDGRLAVAPVALITPALDAHIRVHRDEIVVALTDWPPPEPPWFKAWMREDDARRIATMAAAMQRKANPQSDPGGAR